MKITLKIWALTFLMCAAFNVKAKTTLLDAVIVLSSNDTLKGKISSQVNFVYPDMIIESSFNSKIQFISSNGSIQKFKYDQIQLLKIVDLKSVERIFVPKKGYPRLLELLYDNKIKFYKNYYWNSMNATQDVSLDIFNEEGKRFSIGIFSSKKGKLKKLAKGKTKTLKFIADHKMTDENIIEVLKLYESEMKNKN